MKWRRLALPLLAALVLLPALAGARVGTWQFLATKYGGNRTGPGIKQLSYDSLCAINDTMTVTGALKDTLGFGIQAGLPFTVESTAVINASRFERLALYVRVIGVGGDSSGVVSLALAILPVLSDTLTGGASWDSLSFGLGAGGMTGGLGTSPSAMDSVTAKTGTGFLSAQSASKLQIGEKGISLFTTTVAALNSARRFFLPGGVYVPVNERGGVWDISVPLFRIRVRCLNYLSTTGAQSFTGAASTANTNKPRVQMWVVGMN